MTDTLSYLDVGLCKNLLKDDALGWGDPGWSELQINSGTRSFIEINRGRYTDIWGISNEPVKFAPLNKTMMDHDYNFHNKCPYSSFEEMCLANAEELLNTGKPIGLFYSGGIDSLLILASLLALGDKRVYDQVSIFLSYESILENYNVYHKHIRTKFRIFDSKTYTELPSQLDWLYIQGDPKSWYIRGAWIDLLVQRKDHYTIMTPDLFKKYWQAGKFPDWQAEWFWEYLQDYKRIWTERTGVTIDTCLHYVWLMSTWCWLPIGTGLIKNLPNLNSKNINPDSFYFPYCKMDSIHWIVNNLHSMYTSDDLGQDSPLVKETIKKFIDVTAQAENKYKKPSLVNIWRNYASTYLALDSNLKPVTDLAPYFQQDHDFKTLEANIYK